MTSPSPGQIARYLRNQYYKTVEEYLFTLADVMAREYRAIVAAGFVLQLDCPDLAMSYALYPGIALDDYRKIIALNVEALNQAVKDLPADRMRMPRWPKRCFAMIRIASFSDIALRLFRRIPSVS